MKKIILLIIICVFFSLIGCSYRVSSDQETSSKVLDMVAEPEITSISIKIIDKEIVYDEKNSISILGTYDGVKYSLHVFLIFDGENISKEYARLVATMFYCENAMSETFNGNYSLFLKSNEESGVLIFKNNELISAPLYPAKYTEFEENLDQETHGETAVEEYNYIIDNIKDIG